MKKTQKSIELVATVAATLVAGSSMTAPAAYATQGFAVLGKASSVRSELIQKAAPLYLADASKGDKGSEMKCGEGKCGDKKEKSAEGKCGEGKCGDKKEKSAEGKCGEGKCGDKKGH